MQSYLIQVSLLCFRTRNDNYDERNAYASLTLDPKDVEYQAEVAAGDGMDAEGF